MKRFWSAVGYIFAWGFVIGLIVLAGCGMANDKRNSKPSPCQYEDK